MIKIRIMGLPEEVETTANQLCQQLPIEQKSKQYTNRNSDFVRGYLEIASPPPHREGVSGTNIEVLNLTARTRNNLMRSGYSTIEDILHLGYAGLFKIRNMGRISCEEVMKKMNAHGYLMEKPAYFN